MLADAPSPTFLESLFAQALLNNKDNCVCKICGHSTALYDVVDLGKECGLSPYPVGLCGVPVYYRRCMQCQFVFTSFFDEFSTEDWATYIYNKEYERIDPDYGLARPAGNAQLLRAFLLGRKRQTCGFDFGGGNGMTAKLMRAIGFQFDSYDPHGDNLVQPELDGKYNFVSAFEVFEHLVDPAEALNQILSKASKNQLIILIGTGTTDDVLQDKNRLAWDYAAPRNGHISLFSKAALLTLAQSHELRFLSLSKGTHFMFRGYSPLVILLRAYMAKALSKLIFPFFRQ